MEVFIVDTNEFECNVLKDFVRDLGHSVSACTEVPASVEECCGDGKKPDILLLGIPATGSEGRSYVEQMASVCPDIPLIAVADIGFMVPKESVLSQHIFAFVRRPLQLEELDFLLSRFGEASARER